MIYVFLYQLFQMKNPARWHRNAAVIAVDRSALMAIILNESEADSCIAVLEAERNLVISAGTVAETMIVAGRRHVAEEMAQIINGLGFEIVNVTLPAARQVAQAYAQWGKGVHPAPLSVLAQHVVRTVDAVAQKLVVERLAGDAERRDGLAHITIVEAQRAADDLGFKTL